MGRSILGGAIGVGIGLGLMLVTAAIVAVFSVCGWIAGTEDPFHMFTQASEIRGWAACAFGSSVFGGLLGLFFGSVAD